jgi:protein phosphatase
MMHTNDFSFYRPKSSSAVAEPATAQPTANVEAAPHKKISLAVGKFSDVGHVRELNEDALITLTAEYQQGEESIAVGVFAIADGMGGYEHGEKASELAIRVAANSLLNSFVIPTLNDDHSNMPLYEIMKEATLAAHAQIRENFLGSGTTLTLAVIVDDSLAVSYVGDTRAYRYADGQLKQITTDHSLGQKLMEIGQLPIDETMSNLGRNLLLRVLGQSETFEVDFHFCAFESGQRLLLCSDGLWGQVKHELLERIVYRATDPQVACQELIGLANAAGGHDNITAILVMAH